MVLVSLGRPELMASAVPRVTPGIANRQKIPIPMSAVGIYCCKSPFARGVGNSAGCRCDFRVKMRGTSFPHVKLTSDFANTSEAIRIGDCFLFDRFAKNSSPCNFRLLQQYLHERAEISWAEHVRSAQVFQTSTCSAIESASSISMPRYLTVLSIFVWPSKSCTARRLPVRR